MAPASSAELVATEPNSKAMSKVRGPHKIFTVMNSTLAILKLGIEKIIGIDREIQAAGFQEDSNLTCNNCHTKKEPSPTLKNETKCLFDEQFVIDKFVCHIT